MDGQLLGVFRRRGSRLRVKESLQRGLTVIVT